MDHGVRWEGARPAEGRGHGQAGSEARPGGGRRKAGAALPGKAAPELQLGLTGPGRWSHPELRRPRPRPRSAPLLRAGCRRCRRFLPPPAWAPAPLVQVRSPRPGPSPLAAPAAAAAECDSPGRPPAPAPAPQALLLPSRPHPPGPAGSQPPPPNGAASGPPSSQTHPGHLGAPHGASRAGEVPGCPCT